MKILNCKMSQLLFMGIISVSMSLFATPASAGRADTCVDTQALGLLPSHSSGKPPFHRHVTKQNISDIKKISDASPVYLKWKPPFSRYQLKQDRLEHAQLAKLEKVGGVNKPLIVSPSPFNKKGARPPFNRN